MRCKRENGEKNPNRLEAKNEQRKKARARRENQTQWPVWDYFMQSGGKYGQFLLTTKSPELIALQREICSSFTLAQVRR